MSEPLQPDFDAETLRESYPDSTAVQARIEQLHADIREAPDEIAELMARGELVDLLRASDATDEALNEGLAAVDRADIAGSPAQQHTARIRLANVHQLRGEFADSNVLFTELLAVAQQFGAVIDAYTHQLAGSNDYDQQHWADAREHFARASAIREELELADDEREASRLSLAASLRRLAQP